MKKVIGILICLFALNIVSPIGSAQTFNEYGLTSELTLQKLNQLYTAEQLTEFPNAKNVSLSKKWTINFNKAIPEKNILGAVVVHNNELIPITLEGLHSKQLKIYATNQFPPNAQLQLRIYLKNGKWYTLSFTTEDLIRDVSHLNNSYDEPITLYLNDHIKNQFIDKRNYYTLHVTNPGFLEISDNTTIGTGKFLEIYRNDTIYSYPYVDYTSDSSKIYLLAGTYQLRISSYEEQNFYTLKTTFTEDSNGPLAKNLHFNSAETLEIEQRIDKRFLPIKESSKQIEHYYKVTVDSPSALRLYTDYYSNDQFDIELYNESKTLMNTSSPESSGDSFFYVNAGTYYIKLFTDMPYSVYEFELKSISPILTEEDVQKRWQLLKQQWALLNA